jgi:hypothetical protein
VATTEIVARDETTASSPPETTDASGQQDRHTIRSYAVLTAAFNAALAASLAAAASGDRLPQRLATRDLVLLGVATHKLSRFITKDKVTRPIRAPFTEVEGRGPPGELEEHPRGKGARRAIGELLSCPFCLDAWVANGFVSGTLFAPRVTRAVASLFVVVAISDSLQLLYRGLERRM